MEPVRAYAHAKVNLHLGVGPARADGYHELATVFQALSLRDEVELAPTGVDALGPMVASLSAAGPFAAGVPEDETNLAWRAVEQVAARFRAEHGARVLPQVDIALHKGIPAAGGMAGGSADAAAALVLADELCARAYEVSGLGREALLEIAAGLGSDVPFILMGETALGLGRGEQLTPLLARGWYTWAIITNAQGLSTPAVFKKLDELRAAGRVAKPSLDTAGVARALLSGEPAQLAQALHNDMQPAAISLLPQLRKVLESGKNAGALAGLVSGSGPTCAFLVEDEDQAREVIAQVTADNRGTRGYVAWGPAPGVERV